MMRKRPCASWGGRSYEEGVAAGIEQGKTEGRLVGEEQLLFRLICTKLKKGKTPEGDCGRTGGRCFQGRTDL